MISDTKTRYRDLVESYLESVASPVAPIGRFERLAVDRYRFDLETAADRGWVFDESKALNAMAFFPGELRHFVDRWAGEPFELSEYQAFLVWQLWGWRSIDDRTRRFQRLYLSVGRKNGKTTLIAGLMLLCFFCEKDAGGQHFCTAPTKKQSALLYETCKYFIRQNPRLAKRCTIYESKQVIVNSETNATISLMSPGPGHGFNLSTCSLDEVHEWRTQRELDFYDAMTTASGSRRSPLMMCLTTAGDPGGLSPLWQNEEGYCEKVLESATQHPIDDRYLGMIYRLDKDDDPYDLKNLRKGNPNLDISVSSDWLASQVNEARYRPDSKQKLMRFHHNFPTSAAEVAIDPEVWAKCRIDEPEEEPSECHAGLDLGRSYDWSALSLAIPLEEQNTYLLRSWAWTCQQNPDVDILREPYQSWLRDGYLKVHPGDSVDFAAIGEDIVDILSRYEVLSFYFDERDARVITQMIEKEVAVTPERFPQNAQHYNEPLKMLMKRVGQGTVKHPGNPSLTWQMTNMTIKREPNSGYVMPVKAVKYRKIDAAVAAVMAFAGALFVEKRVLDHYEENDLLSF